LSTRDKVVSSILGLLILATIGGTVYVAHSPPAREMFTDFYVLRIDGKATDYPRELMVGEEGRVLLGIVNHEFQEMSYRVAVRMDGANSDEIGPVVLQHEQEWQQEVSFTPKKTGGNQKVEFLLFKEGEAEHYSLLSLWLDVKEKG
jgi:uncharacterized membrane protein